MKKDKTAANQCTMPGRPTVSLDLEISLYVDALRSSSNRVRYIIIITTVVTGLIFLSHRNSHEDSWTAARLQKARSAATMLAEEGFICGFGADNGMRSFERYPEKRTQGLDTHPGANTGAALWKEVRGINNPASICAILEELEKERIRRIALLQAPILNASFDVNDLGHLGGVSLCLLMSLLCYCIVRQHENLYLALYKVRRLLDKECRSDAGESLANLLYHSLAMSQVFNSPPTLARWKPSPLNFLSRVMFFMPAAIYLILVNYNIASLPYALSLKPISIISGMGTQLTLFAICASLGLVCYIYARVGDKRWQKTFSYINPRRARGPQPRWSKWVRLELNISGRRSSLYRVISLLVLAAAFGTTPLYVEMDREWSYFLFSYGALCALLSVWYWFRADRSTPRAGSRRLTLVVRRQLRDLFNGSGEKLGQFRPPG